MYLISSWLSVTVDCETVAAGICEPWPQPMLKPVDGTVRLVTAAVVREMRKHFNCTSKSDFGGPLQVEVRQVFVLITVT